MNRVHELCTKKLRTLSPSAPLTHPNPRPPKTYSKIPQTRARSPSLLGIGGNLTRRDWSRHYGFLRHLPLLSVVRTRTRGSVSCSHPLPSSVPSFTDGRILRLVSKFPPFLFPSVTRAKTPKVGPTNLRLRPKNGFSRDPSKWSLQIPQIVLG